jgi:hypothetical protein
MSEVNIKSTSGKRVFPDVQLLLLFPEMWAAYSVLT